MKKFVGIDLGTGNTFIYVNGRGIIFSEPTVVAIDTKTGHVNEIGYFASKMLGRVPVNIDVIKPIQRGVPARMNPTILYMNLKDDENE